MKDIQLSSTQRRLLYGFLLLLLIVKLLMMWQTPILDPSESRYAEISRKMVETGDWITPQFDYGIPFWGKPPLSTWVSALGILTLGNSAFAARFPVFLVSLGILYLLYAWVRDYRNRDTALIATVILSTIPIFNYLSGTVMTDICLLATTTLVMVAFHRALMGEKHTTLWSYLFFVGVGIGFLAKGPAATVLAALPIFTWVLLSNKWKEIYMKLPWVSGTLLALLIGLPWYIMAECKTPGFINYFIVGEHFNRFVVTGWKGDLYGSAHHEPIGTIWIFWLLTAIPWSITLIILVGKLIRHRKTISPTVATKETASYLACWLIAPLVFFTFARNIIPTYALTSIPAIPLLTIELYALTRNKQEITKAVSRTFSIISCSLLLLFTGVWIASSYYPSKIPKFTQQPIISRFHQLSQPGADITYWKKRCHSAEFYTNGHAKQINTISQLQELLDNNSQDFIVIETKKHLPPPYADHFLGVFTFQKYTLLEETKIR